MRFASVLKTRRTRIDVHVYTTRCFVNVTFVIGLQTIT